MVNTCTMIITKGYNKGKLCKVVNQWCKHKKVTCERCNKSFSYQHTYIAHVCTANQTLKVTVKLKPSKPLQVPTLLELKSLQSKITKLSVITDDLYGQIVNQMGKQEGVKFLLDSLEDECLDIVDKVYLSGKDKNQYPIACINKSHFRFLGPGHDVVDDIGGDLIVSKITNSIQNAFLKAIADLIQGHVEDDRIDALYRTYDIRSVHKHIKQLSTTDQRERLRQGLAIKVTNPTHPFFQFQLEE
jgi:uncharacterized C2H2 Zn-finger protein